MTLYRYHFEGNRAITWASYPHWALVWGAKFAKWLGAELLEIEEVRPIEYQLEQRQLPLEGK